MKDKEWYKNIPPEHKYMNMWYEQENGDVVRIPGAHELFVLFGGLVVAGLDEEHRKDPEAVKGAMKALKDIINPLENLTPSAFKPLLDVGFNSNWLGHPIEPEWMRDKKTGLPIEERKRFYTPQLSVEFSKALRELGFQLSPIQTDHILKQMSGGLYQRGQGILDTEREDKHPLLPRAFLRFPNRPTRQLNKFFTERTQLQQRKNAKKINGQEFLQLKRMNLFYKTQVQPIQGRIRRAQKAKTLAAAAEVNRLYGILGARLNRFFDPRGRWEQNFFITLS